MKNQPNVLFLVSDQHDYEVAGYMGDPVIHTPSLDKIASSGVVFEKAYCQSPCCTPSRASFLTGKYCHTIHTWVNHAPIFPEHRTMAHYFTEAGYATCLVGKMHFGGKDQYQGFQHRPYGDLWHGLGHQPDPIDYFPNMPSAMLWNGPAEIPESLIQEVVTSVEAAAFVKEQRSKEPEKPWFVCASYCRPHPPFPVPSRFHRKYEGKVPNEWIQDEDMAAREEYGSLVRKVLHWDDMTTEQNLKARAAYYACIDFVDDCIGKLLRELNEEGLLENTIIVYTADHGEQDGKHGIWDKGHHYENSVRSPLLMCGPGIPKGKRVKTMTGLFDIMPTLFELCNVCIPDDLDGVSLVPFFKGEEKFVPHEHVITEYMAVTSVDRSNYMKAANRPFPSFRSVITERYKYTETYETDEQIPILFDHKTDPNEYVSQHGKPEYAEIEAKLKTVLNKQHTTDEWAEIVTQDGERAKEYRDGIKPSMPNQYVLKDGRIFDAEKSLYDVRWLQTSNENIYAGYIPQRRH